MFQWKKLNLESESFNADRLLMTLAEKFKYDVEMVAFEDKKAKIMATDLLHHFAFRVLEKEKNESKNYII